MEALYPNLQPPLPSWLVRVAALGPHVRHAAGDIARLLKQDFGKFSETCFTAGGSEWNHAVRFLCAAATLRPALLAPDIHASTVLHALHMKEGLSQLYEYCQIIAAYGEQLQALDPNALKTMKDQAAWQAELDALRQEVEAWCTQAPQMTIVYAPATKVWRKWQERQGIIHALLLPVRENDPSKLQAAKQAVDRFSDDAQIKREVDYTDRKVLERRAGDAITAKALGQLRMHVREAIGFVRRWIELQDTRPGQSQSYLQRRAEQLRQGVWSRQAAALEDLAAFDQHNPSLPVASGIACCRKTLENIRTLFDQEAPLSVEEPDPRHLLHVDLLHLDSLPLNDQWEPDVADPQAMVESLLKLIAKGQSEWWQTFRMHCERRDHEATARIIEYLEAHLEVSPRLDEFQQTRDKHIRDCQAALRQDAEETRKQVDNAVAFGLLSEKGQVGYMTEIDSERGSRLPVLFECTLPFTFLEPYTTTAGLVPPEMFYGRMRERDSIVDPMGSCFIYGGRQLGKTALLRDVERTFHAPQEGRIARWLDLKVEGIGYDRPIEEIWHLLNKELKKAEVLPANLPDHTGVDRLLEHIQTWLGENEHSRILLLLDEADRFLESDGKEEFVRCARIKGLMDRTQRRFKVVFAGLHNVQRTAGQENHPLAHYGEPICIGPLLDHGEGREARALIERPFTSIGYRFASSDLVTRLLSQTNYYPNLIQLYCSHLLRHVHHPHQAVFDLKTSPPYVITSRHVEEAYHSQDLRKAIRDRFMWTLQLDQRYEVITYSIAYGSILDRERGMVNGFPVSWIRAEAFTWWAEGFRSDTSEEYFRVLLDEMVGLGILRMVDGDRYALRSSNVISLMGTEEEIQAQLLSSREAPTEYEPATFRAAFGKANPDAVSRRSPLTALQESELRSRTRNGVSIIFGCSAAGLAELPDFLISTFGHEFFIHIDSAFDRVGFAKHLNDLGFRVKDGTTLMLISPTCPWSEFWVDDALQKLRGLRSKTSLVHIAFVADPEAAWRWAGPHSPGGELSIQTISLKPWHDAALRQWLDDCGLPSDKSSRERITHITGNRPILLQRFYQRSKADPHRWKHYLEELDTTLHEPKVADELVRSLGLTVHDPRKVWRDLAALGEVSAEDLAGVIEDVPGDIVQQSLRWADLLSLVIPVGHGSWRIDPWVGRLLEARGE